MISRRYPGMREVMTALICLLAGFFPLEAQTTSAQTDLLAFIREKHGPDPGLINGIQFTNRYYRVKEHPFYRGEGSSRGTVTVSGRKYEDVLLNYDLYAQQVILEYQGRNSGVGKIILVTPHVDAFSLEGDYFEKRSLTEEGPLFYQVITADGVSLYIHWSKLMVPNSNDLHYTYYFSKAGRDYLLEFEGSLHPFSGPSSFKSIFRGEARKQVRKYLRQHRFKFREAGSGKLAGLLGFIAGLPQWEEGQ